MAKAEVVGEIAMLVVADAGKFASDLQKKTKKAISKLSQSSTFAPLTRALRKAGEEAGDAFHSGIGGRRARKRQRDSGKDAAEGFIGGALAGLKSGVSAVASAASTVAEAAGTAFKTGISGFGSGVSGLVGAFSSLASAGPVGIAVGIAALVAGLGALLIIGPPVIATLLAVGAAISSLAGFAVAAPAALGVLAAAFGPLILAFQGFGDVIDALQKGDLDKFNEGLKKLSPSARKVAQELKAAMPFFGELRKVAQEALFAPLTGQITKLVKAFGPTLTRGVGGVSGAFGGLIANLLKLAQSPQVVRAFDAIFGATARIVGAFSRPVGSFFLAITRLAETSLPTVERLFTSLAEQVGKFATFLDEAAANGSATKFLDTAVSVLGTLLGITKQIGLVFADVFLDPGLAEAGRGFLAGIEEALGKLHTFFQSPEGKIFIQDLITLTQHLTGTLKDLTPVLGFLLSQFATLVHGAVVLLDLIDRILGKQKQVKNPGAIAGKIVSGAFKGFATGGDVSQEGLYRLAEGNRREVVLPMSNPARARQVAAETGVTGMLLGGQSPSFDVKVYLGTRELEDLVGVEITKSNKAQATALASGPRTE